MRCSVSSEPTKTLDQFTGLSIGMGMGSGGESVNH